MHVFTDALLACKKMPDAIPVVFQPVIQCWGCLECRGAQRLLPVDLGCVLELE